MVKNMANQKIITASSNKHWNFNKGHMTLDFNIDTKVKTDIVDFLDLLKAATAELEKEILEFKS